jgi:hypothetical protein
LRGEKSKHLEIHLCKKNDLDVDQEGSCFFFFLVEWLVDFCAVDPMLACVYTMHAGDYRSGHVQL